MSCDNPTYGAAAVDLALHSHSAMALGAHATARKTDLEDDKQGRSRATANRSKSKGCRHEVQSRIIPDSTETGPEYVWGDEGPFNDRKGH
jgi:hypothetical protein